MPHMHNEEYLVFERLHERERQIEMQHLLTHQRKSQLNSMQRLMGSIGTLFIAIGKSKRISNTVNMPSDGTN
ncbi:MAG: hypothetical protein ACXVDN_05165 [Ktedonobacteraceae bacterium]